MEKIKVFLSMIYPLLLCIFLWAYCEETDFVASEALVIPLIVAVTLFLAMFIVGLVLFFVHVSQEQKAKRKQKEQPKK